MLDFRPPTIADKERIVAFVRDSGRIGCGLTFTNTYLRRDRYEIRIAFDEDTYYKCYGKNGQITGYALPITRGDLGREIDRIWGLRDCVRPS